MIEYALLLLRYYGIRDIVINLHHFGEQIENRLGDGQNFGLKISYSEEPELLDTGGGLLKAKPFLQDGSFIVINTDALIDLNLAALIDFHARTNAAVTLVLRPTHAPISTAPWTSTQAVASAAFSTARRRSSQPARTVKLMFTGVQILEPKIFDYMREHAAGGSSAPPDTPIRACSPAASGFTAFHSTASGRISAHRSGFARRS